MNKPENKSHNKNPTGKGGFKKGKSGNPGGRPKGMASYIRSITKDGKLMADFWLDVMLARGEFKGADTRDRLTATKELADRGVGKPGECHEITVPAAGESVPTENKKGGYVFTIRVSGEEAP